MFIKQLTKKHLSFIIFFLVFFIFILILSIKEPSLTEAFYYNPISIYSEYYGFTPFTPVFPLLFPYLTFPPTLSPVRSLTTIRPSLPNLSSTVPSILSPPPSTTISVPQPITPLVTSAGVIISPTTLFLPLVI